MSSTETFEPSPVKKKARTTMSATTSSDYLLASCDVDERANELSNKISSLWEEFPEMKFIIDSKHLQARAIKTAVQTYKDEMMKNAKQCKEGEFAPLYSLPDEVLQICISFVGKGHYGSVAFASKKLNEAYIKDFGRETSFLEMATSVNLANHCLNDLCESMEEKDEILKAAAVNGNLDILRNVVKDGYDLFPLIELKEVEVHDVDNDTYLFRDDMDWGIGEYELEDCAVHIYVTNENEENTVKLSKLVERGHLHVLKFLHEELNYRKGLQRYIKPAIQHGKIEILKWLHSIDLLDEDDPLNRVHFDSDSNVFKTFYFCDFAVKSGSVEVLQWLLDQEDFDFALDSSIVDYAICSNSLEMIKFCSEKGYHVNDYKEEYEIMNRKSAEFYRLLHELGYEFEGGIEKWVGYGDIVANDFDIIKFLRSISVPWDHRILTHIVACGTLEMIQYAHEDGCPWSSRGDEYEILLETDESWSLDKFKYLINNGCKYDFECRDDYWFINNLVEILRKQQELVLLKFFVGKDSNFDRKLLAQITKGNFWSEGIRYVLKNNNTAKTMQSIEELLFNKLSYSMDFLKYCHNQGLPWCLDPSSNTHLLSKIACYNDLDDVKWAYENGCKGGDLFLYVKEEWERGGIRQRDEWRANCHFFEENDMLPHMNLLEDEDEDDNQLRANLVVIDNSKLKSLVDGGLSFRSEKEKEDHVSQALEKCFEHSYGGYGENVNNRRRLALFRQMRVA